jgi:murein DD-endopeptidase MepM/ murein hydrolase activator NlpD
MTFIDFPEFKMISPTGLGIRNDSQGHGYYGAPRGARKHAGTDYICSPKQDVVAPIDGVITRIAYPYTDKKYEGVILENDFVRLKIFYFIPIPRLIGKQVRQGDVIGYAQDIRKKYGDKMIPHIHLEIDSIDPNLFIRR